MKAGNMNANSRRNVTIRIEINILPIIGHRPAMRLDDSDMDTFVEKMRDESLTNSSIRRYPTDIKAILNRVAIHRPPMIAFNPIRDYKAPQADDAIIIPPSAEEMAAILEAISKPNQQHLRRFVSLCCNPGARPGSAEILSILWRNVSWSSFLLFKQSRG